jgi:outer membrane protein assembly factor BamA
MRVCSAISVLVLGSLLWAQPVPTFHIREVIVEGNNRASAMVVQTTSRLYPGQDVTAIDIQRGIHRLWELGFFANVQVYNEQEAEDSVVLRIEVEEYKSE